MEATGTPWRLGHRPALDGLRGIAILLVVVSHVRTPLFGYAAGDVGVTLFFTLSGFLIATLICEELAEKGSLDFRHFYERRARRLLPALFAVVVVVVAVTLATGLPLTSRAEVFGALFCCRNVIAMFVPIDKGGMLHHTWSLVIEEQFYLVWPLLTVFLWRRRRGLVAVCLAGAFLAAFNRMALWGNAPSERVLFSLDTRLDGILIGCALALVLHRRTVPNLRWAGTTGLLILLAFALAPQGITFMLGLTLTALAGALIITTILADRAPALLVWRPLRRLGRVSYGLYLWHHVVLIFSDRVLGFRNDWVATGLVLIPVSAALTWVSWRYLEKPWLRRRPVDARADQLPVAPGTASGLA